MKQKELLGVFVTKKIYYRASLNTNIDGTPVAVLYDKSATCENLHTRIYYS